MVLLCKRDFLQKGYVDGVIINNFSFKLWRKIIEQGVYVSVRKTLINLTEYLFCTPFANKPIMDDSSSQQDLCLLRNYASKVLFLKHASKAIAEVMNEHFFNSKGLLT